MRIVNCDQKQDLDIFHCFNMFWNNVQDYYKQTTLKGNVKE